MSKNPRDAKIGYNVEWDHSCSASIVKEATVQKMIQKLISFSWAFGEVVSGWIGVDG